MQLANMNVGNVQPLFVIAKPTVLLSTVIVDLPFTARFWEESLPGVNPMDRWFW